MRIKKDARLEITVNFSHIEILRNILDDNC